MINVFLAGDFCPIGRSGLSIHNKEYETLLGGLKFEIDKADLKIINLECPITDNNKAISKSGSNLKADKNVLDFIEYSGFNLLAMANNHILDFGAEGLESTLSLLKSRGFNSVGAGMNIHEAREPFIYSKENYKIGVLNFAENEFSIATETKAGANPVNLISNYHDIKKLKEKVDFLIVFPHGGREHYQLPTPKVRERYRFYVDAGADAVIGHHTHCFSGYENYNKSLIFYSLGNFIFDYKSQYQIGNWTEAFALNLEINEGIITFKLFPFFQGKKENHNIVLMNDKAKNDFEKKISELSKIIIDDDLFYKNWQKYLHSQIREYKSLLTTSNKYIRYAQKKGWLPSKRISFDRSNILLNVFRCETHHEIMTDILEMNYSN